jgi:hypothetical protein
MLQVQGEQVTRHAFISSTRNAHGQLVDVFADAFVENAGVDVADANEPRNAMAARDAVERVLFLPPGMVIDSRDQFTVQGLRYGVEGYAPPIRNFFTSAMFRTEVKLKRVSG